MFTTNTNRKGNKALTYPIGLITADEVADAGGLYEDAVTYDNIIRPVINLKSTVEITRGNGSSTNPYIVKTN